MSENFDIVIIGGGPAGMLAAFRAAEVLRADGRVAKVALFEKNASLGRKLGLTGRGRCNVTNDCPLEEFLAGFGKHGAFLRDAFKKFFVSDLVLFFKTRGVALKKERQGRLFPETDSSRSIVEALKGALAEGGVGIFLSSPVEAIEASGGKVTGVRFKDGRSMSCGAAVVSTGGASYPETGSTGDGVRMAEALAHRLEPFYPALAPLEVEELFAKDLQGLTLKNVRINFIIGRREMTSGIGEMLFTHFGISGPLVLDASAHLSPFLATGEKIRAEIDLKPGLTAQQIEVKLRDELPACGGQKIKNYMNTLLPHRLGPVFLRVCAVDGETLCSQLGAQGRRKVGDALKRFPLTITRARPLREAMVTGGGVSLRDIAPRTMMSRKVSGLYFCGEVLDLAAPSGGFNLQAAFSTGYLAGESAARYLMQKLA